MTNVEDFDAQPLFPCESFLEAMIDKVFAPREDADVLKGLVAGLAAGLLASLVMEQFQFAWNKVSRAIQNVRDEKKPRGRKEDPATVRAAQSISKKVLGKTLASSQKRIAGEAVHYTMGTTSGAIYGMLSEASPLTTTGDGLLFGTAVWVLADEVSVPALGFSKSPQEIPFSTHVYAFASHLVYGWTTEIVRRAVRRVL
jgi:putative membrane protein